MNSSRIGFWLTENRFTITGTIGSKIKVSIDQDSERQTDLENRIHLSYQGDEDEIVQNVEAGNTTLSLGGTQFVGYRGHAKGLFGIKAQAKIGHLNLTLITSQEKSSADQANFTAKGAEGGTTIYAKDYLPNTYFWLGLARGDSIQNIKIFRRVYNKPQSERNDEIPGIAYYYPWGSTEPAIEDSENTEITRFELVDPTQDDYPDIHKEGWLRFPQSLDEHDILAVWYTTTSGDTVGDDTGDTLILKLIKPQNPHPSKLTWIYEWKNVYSLGATNIDPDGLEVQIYRDLSSGIDLTTQDSIPYLELFGLDQVNRDGKREPDGEIDKTNPPLSLGHWGHLIFPDPKPFEYGCRFWQGHLDSNYVPLRDSLPWIYTTPHNELDKKLDFKKYYIKPIFGQSLCSRRTAWTASNNNNVIILSHLITYLPLLRQQGIPFHKCHTVCICFCRLQFPFL